MLLCFSAPSYVLFTGNARFIRSFYLYHYISMRDFCFENAVMCGWKSLDFLFDFH